MICNRWWARWRGQRHMVFSWMSKPPGPWFGSHQFRTGNSCWRWSRGCCGRGTDSHPPTDQSDHWRKELQRYWSKPLHSGLFSNPNFNLFLMIRKNSLIPRLKLKRKSRKKGHYLPPPIAKESRSPLMKKEFSPVHLKHCHQNKKTHLKMNC